MRKYMLRRSAVYNWEKTMGEQDEPIIIINRGLTRTCER